MPNLGTTANRYDGQPPMARIPTNALIAFIVAKFPNSETSDNRADSKVLNNRRATDSPIAIAIGAVPTRICNVEGERSFPKRYLKCPGSFAVVEANVRRSLAVPLDDLSRIAW